MFLQACKEGYCLLKTELTDDTNFSTGISCLRSPHLNTYRSGFVSGDNASGRSGKLLISPDVISNRKMRLEIYTRL